MNNSVKNLLIIYCVGGGFVAFALILQNLALITESVIQFVYGENVILGPAIFLYPYALILSILGMYCGIKIAHNSKTGHRYLKYYLIPQIPVVTISGFTYYFKYGLDLTFYSVFSLPDNTWIAAFFNTSIGSYFNLNFQMVENARNYIVGINIVPVLLLIFMFTVNLRTRRKEKRAAAETKAKKPAAKASKKA